VTNSLFGVITTVQEPSKSVALLASLISKNGSRLVVIGDKKGPLTYDLEGVEFFSLDAQLDLDFELARRVPTGHYSRKNVGYLHAIRHGATCIYETDDDNAPLQSWSPRQETVAACSIEETGWVNVFRLFADSRIWPRGFPLDEVNSSLRCTPNVSVAAIEVRAPIQQGLSNNSPDVDAIWRLVLDEPIQFELGPSVYLPRSAWCPFNSQSTWWFPTAYPLMYLPSYCSFRMTDIWRSFIAQRCIWELDLGVVFHGPEVFQKRNAHDLLRDFADEIPGYTRTKELVSILDRLTLGEGEDDVGDNMLVAYEALSHAGFFPPEEVALVNSWMSDLKRARGFSQIDRDYLELRLGSQAAPRDE